MKKTIFLIFSMLLVFSSLNIHGYSLYTIISSATTGTVVEVIDGDSIVVQLSDGKLALVRLLGVDSEGFNSAYENLYSKLQGATVSIAPDSNIPTPQNRWNSLYVYKSGTMINEEQLATGMGRLGTSYFNIVHIGRLQSAQEKAKSLKLGIWADKGITISVPQRRGTVNINTATATYLKDNLLNVTSALASEIVEYRKKNPFNTVEEIKFVKGFTKAIYDANNSFMTVSTNITTADESELKGLGYITGYEIERILLARERQQFTKITDLKPNMDLSKYETIEPYIDVIYNDFVAATINEYTVNINTATKRQIVQAGASDRLADTIIEYRNFMPIKSLYEIVAIEKSDITDLGAGYLEDNLHGYTDLNLASLYELTSLFGSASESETNARKIIENRPYSNVSAIEKLIGEDDYENIKNLVYINSETDYVNINTATRTVLKDLNLPDTVISAILARQFNMLTSRDVPSIARSYYNQLTIYTDINKASANELKSLSPSMTDSLAYAITGYRLNQPFGSKEELRDFMSSLGYSTIYSSIEDYIVVR